MSALYELENVERRYGGRLALRLPQAVVPPGSVTALTGPNGAGKSTLLRLLAFLEQPDAGVIRFEGRDARQIRPPLRQATLLLQEPYLLKRSVFYNVASGLKFRGDTDNLDARVGEALEMVGLEPARFARRRWFELSGGEAQRVALAARLALRPKALLLDEPTSSLDVASAALVKDAALLASRLWGAAIVVASHDRAWLDKVCDAEVRLQGVSAQ